jgi:hypothetical protein
MILEADGDLVRIQTPTMADYPREFLQKTLSSVMRPGTTYEREDVIRAVAAHLGFQRVREEVRDPIKSAINGAIRKGELGYEGSLIWRE